MRLLSAVARQAERTGIRAREIGESEEVRELLVVHDNVGLIEAAAAVAGLAGDAGDERLAGADLVARVAVEAQLRASLLVVERLSRVRVRALAPDSVGLGVAGAAALGAHQIGRARTRRERAEEQRGGRAVAGALRIER